MRVFVALMPDSASIELLKPILQCGEGWHHPLDVHMTLHFLGRRNKLQVEGVINELSSCLAVEAVEWHASRLGGFPDHINPKVWALEGAANIKLETILSQLKGGVSCELAEGSRIFRPHVSLCTKKSLLSTLEGSVELSELNQIMLRFDRIVLMQSGESTFLNGPRYQVLWQRSLSI
jgi:2'-5' RNA ligase